MEKLSSSSENLKNLKLMPLPNSRYSPDLSTEMLHVITRKQSLSWSHFKTIFDALRARSGADPTLQRASPQHERHQLQVVLQSLGHADFEFDERRRVAVGAPTLTRLPQGGFPTAILCGARAPQTQADLEAACKKHGAALDITPAKKNVLAPPRFKIEARLLSNLEQVARELGIAWAGAPLAWQSANWSPSLDGELQKGRAILGAHLSGRRVRRFDASRCQWQAIYDLDFAPQPGNFLSYSPPEGGVTEHFLVESEVGNEVGNEEGAAHYVPMDLNWGRYAALKKGAKRALIYEEKKCLLAVPEGAPLPATLARAAALCSGWAPELREFDLEWPARVRGELPPRWNFYRDVPAPIAVIIGQKLGQTPIPSNPALSRALQTILNSF